MEVRELLNEYGYPGDSVKIVPGSALSAIEETNSEIGHDAIMNLLNVLDNDFKLPDRDVKEEPMFAAEHVYSIQG